MSVRSELELAESVTADLMADAHELEEHEFILDVDDSDDSGDSADRRAQHVRAVPPPPPPPRRTDARRTPPAAPPAALRSSRSPSGVFPIADVEQALAAAQAQVNGVTAADAEISRLKAQLRARDAYVVEIERALDEWTGHLAAAGIHSPDDLVALLGRARGHAFRVAELATELEQANIEKAELLATSAAVVQTTEVPHDSSPLRRVRGIGRRYAKQLEALGIVNVKQIASWTNADINRVAAELRIAPSRIKREGWIEQARALNH